MHLQGNRFIPTGLRSTEVQNLEYPYREIESTCGVNYPAPKIRGAMGLDRYPSTLNKHLRQLLLLSFRHRFFVAILQCWWFRVSVLRLSVVARGISCSSVRPMPSVDDQRGELWTVAPFLPRAYVQLARRCARSPLFMVASRLHSLLPKPFLGVPISHQHDVVPALTSCHNPAQNSSIMPLLSLKKSKEEESSSEPVKAAKKKNKAKKSKNKSKDPEPVVEEAEKKKSMFPRKNEKKAKNEVAEDSEEKKSKKKKKKSSKVVEDDEDSTVAEDEMDEKNKKRGLFGKKKSKKKAEEPEVDIPALQQELEDTKKKLEEVQSKYNTLYSWYSSAPSLDA